MKEQPPNQERKQAMKLKMNSAITMPKASSVPMRAPCLADCGEALKQNGSAVEPHPSEISESTACAFQEPTAHRES